MARSEQSDDPRRGVAGAAAEAPKQLLAAPLSSVWRLLLERVLPSLTIFFGERQPLVWLLALIVGAGAAYLAIAFRMFIGFVQLPWLGTSSESVSAAACALPWWLVLTMPALGGLLVGYSSTL